MKVYVISQIVGFVAFIISLIAYHLNSKKKILNIMRLSNTLTLIHYVLLGAYSGTISKILGLIRDTLVLKKDKYKFLNSNLFLIFFITIYVFFAVLTYKSFFSILPLISAIIYLVVIWNGNDFDVKKAAFIGNILWLIYNIYVFTIVGIISSIIAIISTYLAMLEYRKKEKVFNQKELKNAFKFYNIEDKSMKNNCIKSLELINNDKVLGEKTKRLFHELYYNDDDQRYNELIGKTFDELFENDNKYVTNVIILLGMYIHKKNMKKFNKNQVKIHKERIKEGILRDKNGMSVRTMLWLSHFTLGKIIEVGSLQFQYTNVKYNDAFIKIHIPRNVDFSIQNIKKSIFISKKELKKIYNIKNPKYYCNSWLLGKSTIEFISKDSNIYKFMQLFDIKEHYETNDALRFVFAKQEKDYRKLEAKTSLQKKMKKYLLDGNKLYNGIGILK